MKLQHYEFHNNTLPSKHDCLLYVVSQTNKTKDAMTLNSAINSLTKIVEDTWNKTDCCLFSQKLISKLFEKEICRLLGTSSW